MITRICSMLFIEWVGIAYNDPMHKPHNCIVFYILCRVHRNVRNRIVLICATDANLSLSLSQFAIIPCDAFIYKHCRFCYYIPIMYGMHYGSRVIELSD